MVEGATLGTVCALDSDPRQWDAEDRAVLAALSRVAGAELTVRLIDRRGPAGDRAARRAAIGDGLTGLAGLLRAGRAGADTLAPPVADLVEHFADQLVPA